MNDKEKFVLISVMIFCLYPPLIVARIEIPASKNEYQNLVQNGTTIVEFTSRWCMNIIS